MLEQHLLYDPEKIRSGPVEQVHALRIGSEEVNELGPFDVEPDEFGIEFIEYHAQGLSHPLNVLSFILILRLAHDSVAHQVSQIFSGDSLSAVVGQFE